MNIFVVQSSNFFYPVTRGLDSIDYYIEILYGDSFEYFVIFICQVHPLCLSQQHH